MCAESPMIRRMKNKRFSSKANFPKKGMIRIMLGVFAIVIGVNVFGALFNNDSLDKVNNPKVIKKNEKKEPKSEQKKYPFSSSDVSDLLNNNHHFESTMDTLARNGNSYFVHYSIDTTLQKLGNKLMKMYHPKYGAVVAMDPVTGRILSLVSYVNDSVPKIGDDDLYCRSTFPAASIFKTITAAAVIEKANYSSQSIVRHVGKKSTLYKYQLLENLSSYTELPFEEAYANSINPVFARLAMYVVGENSISEYGSKFGFNSSVPFELSNESSRLIHTDTAFTLAELASGFNQNTTISPLLGALIASAICENGAMPKPSLVDSIKNGDKCEYKAEAQTWRTPIKENTARELRVMMHSVAKYGTARKSFRTIRQTALFDTLEWGGKTGSVDKDSAGRVDWFIGFAKNPKNRNERIAVGVVTVHGAYWTVHSSYIAAEYFRTYINTLRKNEKLKKEQIETLVSKDTGESPKQQNKAQAHM